MDYEKKYKEAFEKAKKFYEQGTITESLSYIFPELKESEEERIRKWLIAQLQIKIGDNATLNNMIYKAIAWLEKQGKVPVTIDVNKMVRDYANNKECGNERFGKPVNCMIRAYCQGITDTISILNSEKQGEQKPCDYENANIQQKDFAPKAGPKFKVKDWVVLMVGELSATLQIVNVDTDKKLYWFNDNSYLPIVDEECLHLWTIKDAKDGDVLTDGTTIIFIFKDLLSDGSVLSYCDYNTDSGVSDACCPLSMNLMCSKITPATKEQRNSLMKALTDAGYTFDFDKKELKKVEK